MRINLGDDTITIEEIREKLESKFPDYEFSMRGKKVLVVKKSKTVGAQVMIFRKRLNINGNFPSMGAQMLFMVSIILLGVLIPIIIYFAAFHKKFKAFEKELNDAIMEEYQEVE
ncbi:MAG: hypothetical protein MK078_13240 [Crocinitomicaceae bacterium]|nr:hypothetical protein [Crocinitomicaceae bacterium]